MGEEKEGRRVERRGKRGWGGVEGKEDSVPWIGSTRKAPMLFPSFSRTALRAAVSL